MKRTVKRSKLRATIVFRLTEDFYLLTTTVTLLYHTYSFTWTLLVFNETRLVPGITTRRGVVGDEYG